MTRRQRRLRTCWAGLLLFATVACSPAGDRPSAQSWPPEPTPAFAEDVIVVNLCDARDRAHDHQEAAHAFARAHGPLHDVARQLADHDRALAGRLHEAKQQVESALQASPDDRALADRLDQLLQVARNGLERLGATVTDLCLSPPGTDSP